MDYESNSTVVVAGNTGNLTKAGYKFVCWNTASNGSGTSYSGGTGTFTINGDTTLYAMWAFDQKSNVNIALNKTASASGFTNTEESPAKSLDGSISTKWCSTNSGDKWLVVDLGGFYSLNRYVVKHAYAGGEDSTYNTKNFRLDVSIDNINWETVNSVSNNTQDITDILFATVQARYVRLYITTPTQIADTAARIYELEFYNTPLNVKYDNNSSTSGTTPSDVTVYEVGSTVTVLGNTGNLKRISYNFGGWNTEANGSGTNYTAGTGTFVITSNITLYAQWLPVMINGITIDSNNVLKSVKVVSNIYTNSTACVIAVICDSATNKVEKIDYVDVTLSRDGNEQIVNLNDRIIYSTGKKIKVLVLESLTNMNPLMNYYVYSE